MEGTSSSACNLGIEDVDEAVAVAAGWSWNVWWREYPSGVFAVANEGSCLLIEDLIDANVTLVVADGVGGQRSVVIRKGVAGNVWRRKCGNDAFSKRGDRRIVEGDNSIGVALASQRVPQ